MTSISPDITLGELVTQHPELARELDRRHLDYCCGGSTRLAEACASAGLDPASVLGELAAAATEASLPDWLTFGAAQLVDHLEATHHRYLWDELPRIDALMTKVLAVHGERHPELQRIAECFGELRADMEPHLVKEERVLFPMVRELARSDQLPGFHCGSLRNPISVMLSEHDRVGELLANLRRLTNGYRPPADGCASYTALFVAFDELEHDTHEHVHKENHRLFPLAVELEARLTAVDTRS
jgi:regulator of cell morphogenesis and NO signaling